MGNTISTPPNILFLLDHVHSPGSPLQHHHTHIPHSPKPSSSSPSTHATTSTSSSSPSSPIPILTLYKILPKSQTSSSEFQSILHSLCSKLRLDKAGSPDGPEGIWPKGYKPVALFYLNGDFKNPAWNGVASVLFEWVGVEGDAGMGKGEDRTEAEPFLYPFPYRYERLLSKLPSSPSHPHTLPPYSHTPVPTFPHHFIHIYSPTHFAQSLGDVLKTLTKSGLLSQVQISVDKERLASMEAYALFWAKGRWEGLVWGEDEGRGMREEWEGELGDVWGEGGGS
jgi:hypothetical protein